MAFAASCDNPDLQKMYEDLNHDKAHALLHTEYTSKQVTLEGLIAKYK